MVKPKTTKRKPAKSKSLKPDTQPAKPQLQRVFHTVKQTAGIRVTEDIAMTYATFWACVGFIADSIASLPLHHMKARPGGGADIVYESPVDWLCQNESNPETAAFQFRETVIAHALVWGNGYAEIERDMAGRPVWLWQITPDRVKVDRLASGQLIYEVANQNQPNTILMPEDVFHLKGLGFDGVVGYPVVQYAARSIGGAISVDESASTFYGNDATPGGLLKHPRRLSENARKDLLDSWQARHGGSRNRRMIALLEEGLEYQQTGVPPETSQLIENRQFGPVDITRWFRVPPHKVGILDRATFSNIEQQELQAIIDCLMPWAVRFEQEVNRKCFGRTSRGSNYVKHNFNARLRGDAQMRAQLYQMMLLFGVSSINEVRDKEDMNPIGTDGDKRFVQRNMITLDQAGMPEPAPGAALPQTTPQEKPAEEEDQEFRYLTPDELLAPVLLDGMKRVLRRESKMLADAKNIDESLPNIKQSQIEYMNDILKPGTEALSRMLGGGISRVGFALDSLGMKYSADLAKRSCDQSDKDYAALATEYVGLLTRLIVALSERKR